MSVKSSFISLSTRILLYPLIGFGIIHTFGTRHTLGSREYFISGLISTLYTAVLWEVNQLIVQRMKQRFPDYTQTSKRILTQAGIGLVYTIIMLACIQLCLNVIFNEPLFDLADMQNTINPSLLATFIVTTFAEAAYFFERWKKSILEAEQLKRAHIQSQYETLKNQVNPHFLFNSLNTVVTIIPGDPQTAVEFVQKLANVYRYVLQSKDKEAVSLTEEMQIAEAYIFLVKTRFGNNLQVSVSVNRQALDQYVAPLTVQMLLENAIKHNVVSSEKPLCIEIYTGQDNSLVIKNNLQMKQSLAPAQSTHTGLANIT